MKNLSVTIILLFLFSGLYGQTIFHGKVKIEFEKTIYAKQLMRSIDTRWYEMMKDRIPETMVSYYDFIGDTTKSVYKPGRETVYDPRSPFQGLADKNIVYNDYRSRTTISQKPVFEETFLVQDSLLNIKWKLTSDTRNIAGFECRKAVGIFDDTIAVFAFYTDEILISAGPESIHGLPGMILGLGMPRIHTTWFATRVEINGINMNQVMPATKGKKVDRQTMIQSLDKVLSNWGSYGKNFLWNFLI